MDTQVPPWPIKQTQKQNRNKYVNTKMDFLKLKSGNNTFFVALIVFTDQKPTPVDDSFAKLSNYTADHLHLIQCWQNTLKKICQLERKCFSFSLV